MGQTKQSIERPVSLKNGIIGGLRFEIFESQTTHWLFDRARKRFLRLPSEVTVDASVLGLRWTPYQELYFNGRDALVVLDAAGTCRLRVAAA
jgi:hypothetical protein